MPWKVRGENPEDPNARLFALTGEMAVFKPGDPTKAITYGCGFAFSLAMASHDPMNEFGKGYCYTNEEGWGKYRIPVDMHGNSVLTGEGAGQGDKKRFTVKEVEVFLVQ